MSSNGSGNRSRKNAQEIVAVALAVGKTATEAARAGGVSARTISRWIADATFRRRVQELRSEIVSRAASRLADATVEAAEVARKLLKSRKESVRLAACRVIFEHATRLRDTVELQQRLESLEALTKTTVDRDGHT